MLTDEEILEPFECPDSLYDFDFHTPENAADARGVWSWAIDGHLQQSEQVRIDDKDLLLGTFAIYKAVDFTDGRVSALVRSWDDDTVGIVARYQDDHHHYRLRFRPYDWALERLDGARTTLAGGTLSAPLQLGHTLTMELLGTTIRAFLDGDLLAEVEDDMYASGKVALHCRLMTVAFDNFHVLRY